MHKVNLTQREIDSLLWDIQGSDSPRSPAKPARERGSRGIRRYWLGEEEPSTHPQLPLLADIHEQFAVNVRNTLNRHLHDSCQVSAVPPRYQRYRDYLQQLMTPASLNILQLVPLEGNVLVVLDTTLVYLLVDNVFGSVMDYHLRVEGRDFSPTENSIIRHLVTELSEDYRQAWQMVMPLTVSVQRSDINPQAIHLTSPSQFVVCSTLQIEAGSNNGLMEVCLPISLLEPLRTRLTHPPHLATLDQQQQWQVQLQEDVYNSEVELVAQLGKINLSISEITHMKVGDILPFAEPKQVQVVASDVSLFTGKVGVSDGNYALQVEEIHGSS